MLLLAVLASLCARDCPRWQLHCIPHIAKLVSDFFNGKELNKSIDPDEAVAYATYISLPLCGFRRCSHISTITCASARHSHLLNFVYNIISLL